MVPCCTKQPLRKKLLSGCSGDLFMDDIFFFDLHTRWKCLFFPHFLQIASFAGHTSMLWIGPFPHLQQFVCLEWPLPRPVSDKFVPGLLDFFIASLLIVLCNFHKEELVAGEPIPTIEYMSQPFSRLRSPSNFSCSDNVSSHMLATSISLTIS